MSRDEFFGGNLMQNKVFSNLSDVNGKKIALIGIGRSHLPLIPLLKKYGAEVIACDKRTREDLGESAKKAEEYGAKLSLGENYLENIDVDYAFRTPGMRFYCDELNALREKGVIITSEMEMFFSLCPCKIIAITGSDGKTTTTSVISEMLKNEGKTVHLGGNIGKPLLPEIESIKPTDFAVVELSSFQLISMKQNPFISVVTNLQPNHLDIHKDMQEYIDSKKNILLYQEENEKAVLNLDNEITNSFEKCTKAQVYKFSRTQPVDKGCFLKDNAIFYTDNGECEKVIDIEKIKIPGMHNVENYMTAITAVWGIVSKENIVYTAENFAGVEHRAELVRTFEGVKYYNDSIASSPTRTALGTLSLFDRRIILIAGGYDKHLDYTELGDIICNKVKVLILMGATAKKIETAVLNSKNFDAEKISILHAENMEQAVEFARENATEGDIVSMSPASASFDLYKNFEERGKHFKKLVNDLK